MRWGDLPERAPHPHVSVIAFGSFARRETGTDSDIDVVVMRPMEIDEDDDARVTSIGTWRSAVRRISGNPVEILEVSAEEAASKLRGRSPVWTDIRRDGQVVYGLDIEALRGFSLLIAFDFFSAA